jgi:translocation and assembly module TamB
MSSGTFRKYLIIISKILGWLLAVVLILILIVLVTVQFPAVQTRIADRFARQLSEETGTVIGIDRVAIRLLPGTVTLRGIYVEDIHGDTLVYAGRIYADLTLTALLRNRAHVNSLEVDDLTAYITRTEPDTVFNFQFLAYAFSGTPGNNNAGNEAYGNDGSNGRRPGAGNNNGPDEENGGFSLFLDRVNLQNINILFEDHFSGIHLTSRMGSLQTSLSESDLLNDRYHLGNTSLSQTSIRLFTYEPSVDPDEPEEETTLPDVFLSSLELTGFSFQLEDSDGGRVELATALLEMVPEMIDLGSQRIEIESVNIEDLLASIVSPPGEGNGVVAADAGPVPAEAGFRFDEIMEWTVALADLEISNSEVGILADGRPLSGETFDPENFTLGNLNISARNIYASPDSVRMNIHNMNMLVSETFSVDMLELDARLGSTAGTMDIRVKTQGSSMGISMEIDAGILNFTMEELMGQRILLVIEETSINEDLAYFVPDLRTHYFSLPNAGPVEISTLITGTPSFLNIDHLRISGPEIFSVTAEGDVAGLPEIDSLFLDLERFELWARPDVLAAGIPDIEQPEGISLPQNVQLEGRFRGTLNEFETGLLIKSDHGDFEIAAAMYGNGHEKRSFNGSLTSTSFDVAALLQADFPGQPLSLDLELNGSGLEPGNMELEASLVIGQLLVMDYNYDDISLFVSLADSTATLSTRYRDDNLAFELLTDLGVFKEIFDVEADLTIEYADLYRLGISDGELVVSTSVGAGISLYPEDFFSGIINVSRSSLAIGKDIHDVPAIQVVSRSGIEDYSVEIISGLLSGFYKGNISPAVVPDLLSGHLAEYFTVPQQETADGDAPAGNVTAENVPAGSDSPDAAGQEDTDQPAHRNFNLELHVYPSDIVSRVLMPEVEEYDTLSVLLAYDSFSQRMSLDAIMEDIRYAGMRLRDLALKVSSDREKMNFGVTLETINFNETVLRDLELGGALHDETIDILLSVNDETRQGVFLIGAFIESDQDRLHFMLDPDNLLLNYRNWTIDPDNRITIGEQYLNFENFILGHNGSLLSVNSRAMEEEDDYHDVTDIRISNLDLYDIIGFAHELIPLQGGIIDGTMTLRNIHSQTSFTADMSVSDLQWADQSIETIRLFAEDVEPGQISVEVLLEHQESLLRAAGDFYPGEEPTVELEIVLEKIDMRLIGMFAGDELANVGGTITGNIQVGGNIASPRVTGEINFSDAGFTVTQLNASYYLRDEQIRFDQNIVRFQGFTIRDAFGRTASINGTVNTTDFDNIVFNLNLSTSNFLLMDLPERRGEMYHGTIIMDSNLNLSGSHLSPAVSGRLRLREGSSFTFVLPQPDPEAIGGEGVVEFISPDEEGFHRLVAERDEADELRSSLEVMTISLNLEIDRETIMRVVIDELAGDFLEIQGGGVLSFGIDPGGAINLTGRYEIIEGEYVLSFHEVARRRFTIREGSNIVFTGDPMQSELDITAIYSVRTSPEQLMRPVGRGDQVRDERARRQLPFLVYLNLQGELMSPEISFELDMPPEHQDAFDGALMARLNAINEDESERNKQVFALLILGNFIHESPFAAGGGPGIAATARSSASQILSQQLNRLSDRYIRGVDISFELESYEVDRDDEAIGRTELQVEISRDFFNDRVRVMVGGQIEIEDETHRETRPGDIAGDFMIEYLLSPGGDLLLRGFRQREYGDIIEGELVTTGVSLVFSRSYTRFRDLFRLNGDTVPLPEEAGVVD